MPESVKTVLYQQLEEQEMKVKQMMKSIGSIVNKEVDLAQNLSKTLRELKKVMQTSNRSGKKEKSS